MAQDIQLPCDGEGLCMKCKAKPLIEETLTCGTCATPWHAPCLTALPESLASTLQWECPDCSDLGAGAAAAGAAGGESALVAAIRQIEADASLTEKEKARRRQRLLSGKSVDEDEDEDGKGRNGKGKAVGGGSDVLDVLDAGIQCSFCMLLPDRPVTTPCGHNFCLKCFQRWVGQGNRTCAKCRSAIPQKMASQPRINDSLVAIIRVAKMSKSAVSGGQVKVYHFSHNQHKPEKAYTTERAKKTGKANACSGKIMVTVPPDHFGPIPAENDPVRKTGVLVGESWADRLDCRQWGAHLPHVAGIAGQSNYGAQSVALSGGYLDDEDHGEWFLYTGSGGRDLSGNKRTNKEQSFDQKFEKLNEALRVSCKKGYPVRVIRSHKEKRSSYAPHLGLRYDGCYRIEKCWRKVRTDGFKICRYLFVRCDNEPAPWTSDERGDVPRPLPKVAELKKAVDITERKESPAWDFDEEDSRWKWKTPPPASRKVVATFSAADRKISRKAQNLCFREKLFREFSCLLCREVMNKPVTTPCAHNFCQNCLVAAFEGKTALRERNRGGRTLRAQKNILKCPACPTDIADVLQNPMVNSELQAVIESLQSKAKVEEEPEENEDDEEELDADESIDTEAEVNDSGDSGDLQDSSMMTESGANKRKRIEATDPSVDGDQLEDKVVAPKDSQVKRLIPDGVTEVEGNDSPLSTLQVRSSDDDLE